MPIKDPIKLRACRREWRAKNRGVITAYRKQWRTAHREHLQAQERAYRLANQDKIRAYQVAYRQKHQDTAKAYQITYTANKLGKITPILSWSPEDVRPFDAYRPLFTETQGPAKPDRITVKLCHAIFNDEKEPPCPNTESQDSKSRTCKVTD